MKIVAKDVGKVWGRPDDPASVVALESFSHVMRSNTVTCLLGPSGCGKSTLMEIIGGIERLTSGSLDIIDDSVPGSDPAGREAIPSERPKHLSTIVWQDFNLFPWMTIGRNAGFGLEMKGASKEYREERVKDLLARVGLAHFIDHYPSQLSGGMKQRVAIARAFAVDPKIVLMDEPFGALDAQTRMVMQEELLAMLDAERRTVVFVTHSIEEALLLGDEVIVMTARPGRVADVIDVPFARPRTLAGLRPDPLYQELYQRAYETLKDEVSRAQQMELEKIGGSR